VSRARRIRDPVHGFISLRSTECDLLDTPALQRLRGIHQLAMAYLVYPGALHTRFDHTLGVLHVADSLCTELGIDEDHTRLIRLAALLHDLGHGPFSHVSEDVLRDVPAPAGLATKAGKKEKIHELITQKIILEHDDLKTIGEPERRDIARLLKDGLDKRVYRDIVSGPLDADKQDYLLRDSYFCGVQYGVYDLAQLHKTLTIGKDGDDEALMVKANGVHALEQFVLAKYYLFTQVYRHKVRLIADNMLIRALLLGVTEDKIGFLKRLYVYEDSKKYLTNYLKWDDRRVITELLQSRYERTYAGRVFRRLINRRLFKRILTLKLRDLPPAVVESLEKNFAKERGGLEAAIADKLKSLCPAQAAEIDGKLVVLHQFKIDSVRTQSRNSEGPILVTGRQQPIPFEEESVLFKSINAGLNEAYLECYAPVEYRDDREKNNLLGGMKEFITGLVVRTFDHQAGRAQRPGKDKRP